MNKLKKQSLNKKKRKQDHSRLSAQGASFETFTNAILSVSIEEIREVERQSGIDRRR